MGEVPPDDGTGIHAMGDPEASPGWDADKPWSGTEAPDTASLDLPRDGSVLARMAEAIGSVPRVQLRDTRPEPETPLDSPLSPEMSADTGHSEELDRDADGCRPSSPGLPADTGRYQLLGEIGLGGMGAVLKGRDPDLGRDLAIKVLLEKYHGNPELARRFIEEAQIGGQLQHPGIVPVYEMGQFGARWPYFTMKLVKGRTLASLLAARDTPAHDLPQFLGIFAQVCQTLAYAHARGVIHRDLKPSNIMVGSFGEVQVMDWGLAKVLPQQGTAAEPRPAEPAVSVIRTVRSASDADASHSGVALGTPAYMAPEQAGGDVEAVDERADVFGLGSILCEVLTGQPAYTGPSSDAILRKALRGDTADALRRLDGCGAEAELIILARQCLAAEPDERPRDASEVAAKLTGYLAGVQDRLQVAELARAAEEARAEEAQATAAAAEGRARAERRARRLTVGLAASVVIAGTLGAAGWRWVERDRMSRAAAISARVNTALQQATQLRGQAQRAAVGDLTPWVEALAAAKKAVELLEPGADPALRGQTESLLAAITEEKQAADAAARTAESDRLLLDKLVDIRSAKADDSEGSTSEANYARAFREAGIDVTALPPGEVGAKIKARPAAVAANLVAALDDWAAVRRARRQDRPGALRLAEAATAADPDPWRVGLRQALDLADRAARAQALRNLAASTQPEIAPAVDLDLLGTALSEVGESKAAEAVLRDGRRRFPADVWLNYDLARFLETQSRREEAIRYYSIARALRPETAHELAHALEGKGESVEAIAVFRDLVGLRPGNGRHWSCHGRLLQERGDRPGSLAALEKAVAILRDTIRLEPGDAAAHFDLGNALRHQGKLAEAITAYRAAIRLKPDFTEAHTNLGNTLHAQGKLAEAVAAYRMAIRIKPDFAPAHTNLGGTLTSQGKLAEAIAAYREAIRLKPDFAMAHYNLALTLHAQGKLAEAVVAYREAIRLQPDEPEAHNNLGFALHTQGKPAEAIAEYREAIRLKPELAIAHCNLGQLLQQQGRFTEALAELERGHALGSQHTDWRYPSAEWVRQARRLVELESRLPALLQGKDRPANAEETLTLADHCYKQQRHGASARFWQEVFQNQPALADDLKAGHRYNAAYAAALAGSGQGKDEPPLDDAAKARWRTQALDWLKADLAAWTKGLESGPVQMRPSIQQTLQHWKADSDLAGIREEPALAKLPADERKACRALWSEVDALLAKVRGNPSP